MMSVVAAIGLALASGSAAAQAPAVGTTFRDCPECPELVVVPAGSFTMGATPEEVAAAGLPAEQGAREVPAHTVTIARPFAVGKYELTVAEYRAFSDATGRPPTMNCITWDSAAMKWQAVAGANWREPGYPQTDRHPVGCLTLADAQAYVEWLSAKTGQRYRVPSEAEWEYIAHAGTRDPIGSSRADICKVGNVSDAARAKAHPGADQDDTRFFACDDGHVYAAPVGSYPANAWGLYDVIGNIWEWTEDCFIPHYNGAPTDGSAWIVPGCDRRIVRSGGWYSRVWFVRPTGRSREAPDYRSSTLGLRVVREIGG
jgi:formylglycine-generating enzyme required for sulfatase activity